MKRVLILISFFILCFACSKNENGETTESVLSNSSYQKFDISHINSGIYFVKIITNVGETVKKVVKQ